MRIQYCLQAQSSVSAAMQLKPDAPAGRARRAGCDDRGPAPWCLNGDLPLHAQRLAALLSTLALWLPLQSLAQADALKAAAAEAGAQTTASGLVYRSLKDGSGPNPTAADVVRVHYRGTLTDGSEFDSSIKRGQPAEFPLGRVIKCWTEGVQRMKVGGKAKLTCPSAIAYGERGTPGGPIPPNATLVFEVELLGIAK
jgi:FKBP-type peptidyl-prolyl cis-trans isomerase FkpA